MAQDARARMWGRGPLSIGTSWPRGKRSARRLEPCPQCSTATTHVFHEKEEGHR